MLKSEIRNQRSEIELRGRRVLVVGLAKTGISAAKFLKEMGADVTATDVSMEFGESGNKDVEELRSAGVTVETGRHTLEYFLSTELIILSPGVPPDIEPLKKAREKGIEIISEIELACNFIREPIIAVAGTNGKTTTTTLIGKIMESAGKKAFVGGNIGLPLIEYVSSGQTAQYLVVEVSSFQLEGIRRFRPYVSILLNITEDHLDRYASFDDYAAAKFRLFENQAAGDFAIINHDDDVIVRRFKAWKTSMTVIPFSSAGVLKNGIYYKGNEIIFCSGGREEAYPTGGIRLKGIHNIENIMAAIAACRMCGIGTGEIQKAVEQFEGLSHRMEFVRELGGVKYYDDSKGTNIGALQKSLEGLHDPVILIAGGKDKGGDYRVLCSLIKEKVKLLILIGEAKDKINDAFKGLTEITMAGSLKECVEKARGRAAAGDVVLLSPACSSFDMFRDYKERGDIFKQIVRAL